MDYWFSRWEEIIAEENDQESPYLLRLREAQTEHAQRMIEYAARSDNPPETVAGIMDYVRQAIGQSMEGLLGEPIDALRMVSSGPAPNWRPEMTEREWRRWIDENPEILVSGGVPGDVLLRQPGVTIFDPPRGVEFTEMSIVPDPADRNALHISMGIRPRYPLHTIQTTINVSGLIDPIEGDDTMFMEEGTYEE